MRCPPLYACDIPCLCVSLSQLVLGQECVCLLRNSEGSVTVSLCLIYVSHLAYSSSGYLCLIQNEFCSPALIFIESPPAHQPRFLVLAVRTSVSGFSYVDIFPLSVHTARLILFQNCKSDTTCPETLSSSTQLFQVLPPPGPKVHFQPYLPLASSINSCSRKGICFPGP